MRLIDCKTIITVRTKTSHHIWGSLICNKKPSVILRASSVEPIGPLTVDQFSFVCLVFGNSNKGMPNLRTFDLCEPGCPLFSQLCIYTCGICYTNPFLEVALAAKAFHIELSRPDIVGSRITPSIAWQAQFTRYEYNEVTSRKWAHEECGKWQQTLPTLLWIPCRVYWLSFIAAGSSHTLSEWHHFKNLLFDLAFGFVIWCVLTRADNLLPFHWYND